ncbi:hypothetical protein D3C71_2204030 [compost metagenome]
MQHLPLVGIAEQVIAFVEITGAKWLQRMFLSNGFKQVFVGLGESPTACEMIP